MSAVLLLGTLLGCGGRTTGVVTRTPVSTTRPAKGTPVPTVTYTPTPASTAPRTVTPISGVTSTPGTPSPLPSPTPTTQPATPSTTATVLQTAPTPAPTQPASESAEITARGVEVYQKHCGHCHALDAAGTAGTLDGPSHDRIGAEAAQRIADPDYSGAATTPAEYIRESIVTPQVYIVEGYAEHHVTMPAFTHLPDEDIEALVQMLLQQQ